MRNDVLAENGKVAEIDSVLVSRPSGPPVVFLVQQGELNEGPLNFIRSTPDMVPSPRIEVVLGAGRLRLSAH